MSEDLALAHRQIWEAIPWVVNGTASPADRQRVEGHLHACVDCRDEFALHSRLHAGMDIDSTAGAAGPAFARLLARIEADADSGDEPFARSPRDDRHAVRKGAAAGLSGRWQPALMAAVVVQAIGLAAFGFGWMQRAATGGMEDTSAPYETLSRVATPTAAATIRFVPDPNLTMAGLQAILADTGLRIVESSEDSAIYGLAPKAASGGESATALAITVARLRAHPGVLLAEPTGAPAAGRR